MTATASQCREAIERAKRDNGFLVPSELCTRAAEHLYSLTFSDLRDTRRNETANSRMLRIVAIKGEASLILAHYLMATRKHQLKPTAIIDVNGVVKGI